MKGAAAARAPPIRKRAAPREHRRPRPRPGPARGGGRKAGGRAGGRGQAGRPGLSASSQLQGGLSPHPSSALKGDLGPGAVPVRRAPRGVRFGGGRGEEQLFCIRGRCWPAWDLATDGDLLDQLPS